MASLTMLRSENVDSKDDQEFAAIASRLEQVELDGLPHSDFVDTPAALSGMLDSLDGLAVEPPSIYIDLEGENLSRDGTISIMQIYALPIDRTYLIDIYSMGEQSFNIKGQNGGTLRDILETPETPKVFFDVRNDSDALYSHYKIKLAGIQDLQLMELATRTFPRGHVSGLAKCIEREGGLSALESQNWIECKGKGLQLFAPERGGSYAVFNKRRLPEETVRYCIQDVQYMPRLWSFYDERLDPKWRQRVSLVSAERVEQSQSDSYVSHGKHKALAPKGWAYL